MSELLLSKITLDVILKVTGAVFACIKPAVIVKACGNEENLSSKVMIGHPHMYLSETKAENVPVTVFISDKVAVTYALNDKGCLVSVGDNWVVGAALKHAPRRVAACAGYHMTVLRAALSCHKIVCAVYFVHMGAFQISSARALPDAFCGGELLSRGYLNFTLTYATLAVFICAVADEICLAVIIKKQRGVDSALIYGNGVRPFTVDIVGINIEILVGGVVSGDHIKPALIAADSGCKNAA